jgi:hypothetical protein
LIHTHRPNVTTPIVFATRMFAAKDPKLVSENDAGCSTSNRPWGMFRLFIPSHPVH